jgi:Uma2 family endonuclease
MLDYKDDYKKYEVIDGVIYNMSPSPHFKHGIIDGNIYEIIKRGLKGSLCRVFIENLDYKYSADEKDNFVIPDIMIVCDRKHLKGGSYDGTPKFIVETLSPSTAKKDRSIKKDLYEKAGVSELWLVSTKGIVEIYYLVDGKYQIEHNYILVDDVEDVDYNAKTIIKLRDFPNIEMTLEDIFEDID